MERVQKVIEELKKLEHIPECGLFSTRNTVGDRMKTVYSDEEIIIDVCWSYDYIEVFGLNDDEFGILKDWYNANASWRAKMN